MMKNFSPLLLFLIFTSIQQTFAGTITGHVREKSSKAAIVGAAVFVKGTNFGGISDTNGNYAIRHVPPGK